VFLGTSAIFSFKDVSSTKNIQIFISIVRVVIIALFLIGPILNIIKEKKIYFPTFSADYLDQGEIKTYNFEIFNFTNFERLFSNISFAFTVNPLILVLTFYSRNDHQH
jgi:hypothetical protein